MSYITRGQISDVPDNIEELLRREREHPPQLTPEEIQESEEIDRLCERLRDEGGGFMQNYPSQGLLEMINMPRGVQQRLAAQGEFEEIVERTLGRRESK